MIKIALFGKMRSGKDTVGELLIKQYNFRRYAFGDGIGELIYNYFPDAFTKGKPREHYQFIGQQLRELDENVWINYMFKTIKEDNFKRSIDMFPENIVITDARQYNEYLALKEDGYIIVKVVTDEQLRLERIKQSGDNFTEEQLNHPTELQVDLVDADFIVENNGDLIDLEYLVSKLIYNIRKDEIDG